MGTFNKNLFLVMIMTLILSFLCKAQSKSADSTSLHSGRWALQFGISSNFTLTSFQGSTIGFKYQISKNNAVRGGITINGISNNGPYTSSGTIGDSSLGSASGSNSNNSVNLSFVVQYLWYMNPSGVVHLYAGAGPIISYYNYKNAYDRPNLYRTNNVGYWVTYSYDYHYSQWAAGAAAVIGVEWFAADWLSLHADYNESIQYQWGSTANNAKESTSSNIYFTPNSLDTSGSTKGWAFSSSAVSFGLSVYL